MAFELDCPNCGRRSHHEFWFGGELRPYDPTAGPERSYEDTWLRENVAGPQAERWFHYAGCRRWLTLRRDTRTNEILGPAGEGRREAGETAGGAGGRESSARPPGL